MTRHLFRSLPRPPLAWQIRRMSGSPLRPATVTWTAGMPSLLGVLQTDTVLPALVLGEDPDPQGPRPALAQLVGRGWVYAEAPITLTTLSPATRPIRPGRPHFLTPCRAPKPAINAPIRSEQQWWQRVSQLGRQCAVLLVPHLDRAAGPAQITTEATHGRVVSSIARLSDIPPASTWQYTRMLP